MERNTKRWVLGAVIVVAALLVWYFWPSDGKFPDGKTVATRPARADAPAGPATKVAETQPVEASAYTEAVNTYRQGLTLLVKANKPIEGRTKLSEALLSGKLDPDRAERARLLLQDLADRMILSGRLYDADPYTFAYTFQAREVLAGRNGVERRLGLHVPAQLILKVNGITDATKIRAGQTLKMIYGPFHAVVTKKDFTLDLYLHRGELPKIFIRRLKVGLGKNGSTPVGMWRLALGKKMVRAPWNPPPNSPIKRKILWGEPDYPLGKMGYWISLEGIDDNTRGQEGYGIHGTDSPESIGRAESLGCIRLADDDIELVYSTLYEKWSTVEIRP